MLLALMNYLKLLPTFITSPFLCHEKKRDNYIMVKTSHGKMKIYYTSRLTSTINRKKKEIIVAK